MSERLTLSPEDAERVRAVEALASRGAPSVAELVECLDDRSWGVRRSVVAGLAQIGEAALPALVAVLRSRRDSERRLAATVDALAASRGDADAAVLRLADENPPPAVLCDVAQVLGRRRSLTAVHRLAGLTRHPDDNVAVAALEALGRIGGGAGLDAVIDLLGGDSFFRIFPAIEVLAQSGDPRAVPALVSLLERPLYATEAARALGATGDERAVPALVSLLAADDDALVRASAVALGALCERQRARRGSSEALEAAIERAASTIDGGAVRRVFAVANLIEQAALARVLGWLSDEAGIDALFSRLATAPAGSSLAGALTAALKRRRGAIDSRLAVALHASEGARRLPLLALAGGRAANGPTIARCLDDDDPAVRAAACEALARIGDPTYVPRLFERLRDGDARVAHAAQGAIQSLGSAETERLALEAAASPDVALRRAGMRIVAYFGYPRGLERLLAAVHDEQPSVREAALAGLAFLDDPRALSALLASARSSEAKARAAAVRALGQRAATAETRGALLAAVEDGDAWVRYYAAQALGRLQGAGAAEALVRHLHDRAEQVRLAVVEALARIAHPEALAALTAESHSLDGDVRHAALLGLGQSGRAEALAPILAATAHRDAATRLVAVSALASFDGEPVLAGLVRAAHDSDEGVRNAAVELLGARPGVAATRALAVLLDEGELRERVARALAEPLADRIEGLRLALDEATEPRAHLVAAVLLERGAEGHATLVTSLGSASPIARRAAVAALAERPSNAAREALERASTADPDPDVRRLAALALERA